MQIENRAWKDPALKMAVLHIKIIKIQLKADSKGCKILLKTVIHQLIK